MTRKEWRIVAAEAQRLKLLGRQVDAIKHLRQHVNCGLKEAWTAANRLGELTPIKVPS